MSAQFVLIPQRREVPLSHRIPARTLEPWQLVEFDTTAPANYEDSGLKQSEYDVVVGPTDERLVTIAKLSGLFEDRFIWLCQHFRIIPCWWEEVRAPSWVRYNGNVLRYSHVKETPVHVETIKAKHTYPLVWQML